MAIVKEFTARNGAHVIVRDDCYRDASPEELERRYEEIRQAIIFAELRAAVHGDQVTSIAGQGVVLDLAL